MIGASNPLGYEAAEKVDDGAMNSIWRSIYVEAISF
jgi:hypothetical protein